jgi:hypothetical protein
MMNYGEFDLDKQNIRMEPPPMRVSSAGRRQDEIHATWRAERQASWIRPRTAGASEPAPGALPRVVAWLAYGGLLPFLGLAVAAAVGGIHADLWRAALFAYGAVILSFSGALHGGIALAAPGLDARQRAALFAWSVVPALLAWPSMLLYVRPATLLLLGGFVAAYWQDRKLVVHAGGKEFLPAWYLSLRLRLTLVACTCIAVGGMWGTG